MLGTCINYTDYPRRHMCLRSFNTRPRLAAAHTAGIRARSLGRHTNSLVGNPRLRVQSYELTISSLREGSWDDHADEHPPDTEPAYI